VISSFFIFGFALLGAGIILKVSSGRVRFDFNFLVI
jgi:hypothetical protein